MVNISLLTVRESTLNSGAPMKKIFVALLATFVAVGMVGCVGKGKAPPPVVTKG
jgi:hypothetical protein